MSEEMKMIAPPLLVELNGTMCLIDNNDYNGWIDGTITVDAKPIRVFDVNKVYSYLVKYPFCKPKVVHYKKPKSSVWFRNGTLVYYPTSDDRYIQPRNINEIQEFDDDYALNEYNATTSSSDALLGEYYNIYK